MDRLPIQEIGFSLHVKKKRPPKPFLLPQCSLSKRQHQPAGLGCKRERNSLSETDSFCKLYLPPPTAPCNAILQRIGNILYFFVLPTNIHTNIACNHITLSPTALLCQITSNNKKCKEKKAPLDGLK